MIVFEVLDICFSLEAAESLLQAFSATYVKFLKFIHPCVNAPRSWQQVAIKFILNSFSYAKIATMY